MTGGPDQDRTRRPWGVLAGLSAWCLVVLVGALRGLDPEVVLLRALVAAAAAVCAGAMAACWPR